MSDFADRPKVVPQHDDCICNPVAFYTDNDCPVHNPMPDDRPVSPEERLREALRKIERVYERTMPGPRDALRDKVLEITNAALSTPAGPSPEPPDGSESSLAKITLAQFMATGDGAFLDNAQADTLREMIRVLIEAAGVARARRAVALSAARPSSPTPEETPHHAWFRCIDGGWGGYQAACSCGWEGEKHPPGAEGKRTARADTLAHDPSARILTARHVPGDDATTKEGR